MRRRAKKLIALCAALAILLGLYASVATLTAEPEEESEPVTVAALTAEDLVSLSWTNADDGTLELVRNSADEDWSYAGDSEFPVDQNYPQAMLDALQEVSASVEIDQPSDLADYGLETPGLTITATGSDGSETVFSIGDENEMTGEYYLSCSADESKVYLVGSTLADAFAYDLYDLVKEEELPTFGQTSSLTVEGGSGTLELVYLEDSTGKTYNPTEFHWFLRDGETLRAVDTSEAEALQSAVTGLSWQLCTDYKADDEELAHYGLDDSATQVELVYLDPDAEEDPGELTFTLLLGNDTDSGTYARLSDSRMVYLIDSTTANTLRYAAWSSLRPGEVCTIDEEQIESLEITVDGQTQTITFEGTATEETTDENGETVTETVSVYRWNGEELPTAEVDALLSALDSLTVTGEGSAAGGEELITIVIHQKVEGYETLTLRLTGQDAATACAELGGSILLADRSAADTLVSCARTLFEE